MAGTARHQSIASTHLQHRHREVGRLLAQLALQLQRRRLGRAPRLLGRAQLRLGLARRARKASGTATHLHARLARILNRSALRIAPLN
eukprot:COSAG01_NODE_10233_length_2214_cov_3.079905_1_plen_88_part_00